MKLNTQPNLEHPDDFYAALMDLHHDRSEAQGQDVNARLILLLANHIGDHEVLMEAIRIARESVPHSRSS